MPIDLQTELLPSWGYEISISALELFQIRRQLAQSITPTAVNIAKVNIDIKTGHAYLPTLNITDKVSVFVSHIIQEV